MDYFFDTSALIKRYVTEAGTAWVRGVVPRSQGHVTHVSRITSAELMSAVYRRHREGHITSRDANAVRLWINRHFIREYQLVEVTKQVTDMAQDLLAKHPLRAYDSIQLASAVIVNMRLIQYSLPPLTFVSSDKRLLTIASTEALPVHEPL